MKPVAWIDPYDLERLPHQDCWVNGQQHKNSVPLYTHPVSKAKDRFPNYESICLQCGTTIYKPFKELTDEEIIEFIESWEGLVVTKRTMEMFRAILRKAQEK